ncbi:MAG: hypothetical protein RJA22_2964 [Verrucomicrobiota bacterium]|jgi:uncharacterized membrane protein
MNFQFTHPHWLLLLPVAWAWVLWLAWRSEVAVSAWRRRSATALRLGVVTLLALGVAGLQWRQPQEGMNVFFLLDRSDSVPASQQDAARRLVNRFAEGRRPGDRAGLLVFGSDAALESTASTQVDLRDTRVLAVVNPERTDIAGAIRLGTAAFPETGQRRLVLFSDGNENLGDGLEAVLKARPLGVTVDVVPVGLARADDVSLAKLVVPARARKGQPFEARIFLQSDRARDAVLRLYRNEQPLGEQPVRLAAGKNLFTFPQTLEAPDLYQYTVQVEAPGDQVPQNNKATAFIHVSGDPRVLMVSSAPEQDRPLAEALRAARLDVRLGGLAALPPTLAGLQSYDAIFLNNVAAGDLGADTQRLLASAVRDFGVGLVCVGGDQAYAAGGYRGTPLEEVLPVSMELDSKKVLPSGAMVLVMHGMEFNNGNQVARDCALGCLDALGPSDEMGVILWDGTERWLFELTKVGPNKEALGAQIAGMNQGDLGDFGGILSRSYAALLKSTANLKHVIVFSDGDPAPPPDRLLADMVASRITLSSVLISGHAGPETMIRMAERGNGRFYNVQNAGQLPQIFIKEAAVILKSAIFEEPFTPRLAQASEMVRGLQGYPVLRGYVCTTPKSRAEVPLVTDKGDPLLAHWQVGLGRAVAWTSDARGRWARDWLGWSQYRQFWTQAAQWALRRVDTADFSSEVTLEKGEGRLTVEALGGAGEFRNFLQLQAVVVSPKGERLTVRLDQSGPGRYEARFPAREVGAYMLNLQEWRDGRIAGQQPLGATVNFSPEFHAPEPNLPWLRRLAEAGGGRLLQLPPDALSADRPLPPALNPFLHDRRPTFQPRDWWETLLRIALVLFVVDVALRRIQLDREQWQRLRAGLRRVVFFWRPAPAPVAADASLTALLARREEVRAARPPAAPPRPELFEPAASPSPSPAAAPVPPPASAGAAPGTAAPSPAASPPQSTADRLLAAKKRARR